MTHNQIEYWKMRNDRIVKDTQNAETKRYNMVQEELKRIDQDLQRDIMAINEKYKNRELQIAEQDLEWKRKYQSMQLANEQKRLSLTAQSNAINALSQRETARANLVQESLSSQRLAIDKSMLPLQKSQISANINKVNASTGLTYRQSETEQARKQNLQSSTFNNIVSPFINLAGSILRAVH